MNRVVKQIPNMITSVRIIAAIALSFVESMSVPFFIIYGLCGFTDAIDGFVARKLHAVSKFGSYLDSFSDLVFYVVMFVKVFPVMRRTLTLTLWIMMAISIGIHASAYIFCGLRFNRFSSLHTYANKVLGAGVYLWPFFLIGEIPALALTYAYILASIGIYASAETLLIHIISPVYDEKNKSIFFLMPKN